MNFPTLPGAVLFAQLSGERVEFSFAFRVRVEESRERWAGGRAVRFFAHRVGGEMERSGRHRRYAILGPDERDEVIDSDDEGKAIYGQRSRHRPVNSVAGR